MKHWLRDASFNSLLRNSGYMAVSRIASGLLGLAALSFTTHSLGTQLFGVLILIHSYAMAASGLVKFQSWQVVIRYGAPALRVGHREQLQQGISFAIGLDVVSGLIGMVLAMASLPLIGAWFHMGRDQIPLAILYCTLLPTMAAATPTGVLRLLDRFDMLSWQSLITPGVRVILAGAAWLLALPFEAFLLIWYATDLLGDLVLWGLAFRELHRRSLLHGLRIGLIKPARQLPGAWRFALTTNFTTSLATAWGPIANLLVGALLNPAAAGQYRVAAGLAEAAKKPADMLAKAFYPEVMRLDLTTRKPWRLMLRGAALSGSMGLLFALVVVAGGRGLIGLLFGEGFEPAFGLLILMLLGLMVTMVTFPFGPMLYAVDRPGVPLMARMVSAAVYIAAIFPLTHLFGLTGAGAAYMLAMLLMVAWMIPPLFQEFQHRTAKAARRAA